MSLYFAYGSNMDESQMRGRCPQSRFEFIAKLQDYRLCFPRYSERRHGGVSSIEQHPGDTVWGVVYQISEIELPLLDKSEGYQKGRPAHENAYNRVSLTVEDAVGQRHDCQVYIANVQRSYLPSRECYMNYIIRGAEQHQPHGIPNAYVERLRKIETSED